MTKLMMNALMLLIFTALNCSAGFAIELDVAKAQGLVGEKSDGYLAARVQSNDVTALINDINNKRREQYQQIANKNGTSLKAVELLAGEKAIEKTQAGHFVQRADGTWLKK